MGIPFSALKSLFQTVPHFVACLTELQKAPASSITERCFFCLMFGVLNFRHKHLPVATSFMSHFYGVISHWTDTKPFYLYCDRNCAFLLSSGLHAGYSVIAKLQHVVY